MEGPLIKFNEIANDSRFTTLIVLVGAHQYTPFYYGKTHCTLELKKQKTKVGLIGLLYKDTWKCAVQRTRKSITIIDFTDKYHNAQ